ncbi:MAG: ABC transporter ATP-binding protein [Tissierellia bacterium]|nr:ABC transporter ATP-binding protein [Tissierellia bacterium]
MVSKIKFILGVNNYNRLKKPAILYLIDSIFNGFNLAFMFLILLDLVEDSLRLKKVLIIIALMILINYIRFLLLNKSAISMQTVMADLMADLRIKIGDHIRDINMGFFNKNSLGNITNIVTNDLNDLETFITIVCVDMIRNIISLIYLALIIIILYPLPAIIQLLILCLEIPVAMRCIKIIKGTGIDLKLNKSSMTSRIIEYIKGIEVFKSYNLTGEKFDRLKHDLENVKEKSIAIETKVLPYLIIASFIVFASLYAALFSAYKLYRLNSMTSTNIITFSIIAISLIYITKLLFGQVLEFNNMSISVDKIYNILKTEKMDYKYKDYEFKNYDIQFDDVHFGYLEDKEVLKGMSFIAKEGQKTALIGDSGSGKSTVLNLIARYWDPDNGKISIGGEDLKNIYPDTILDNISIVFQEVSLLNDTIYENIKMGANKSKDEIIRASKIAHCHEFIIKMENGYETMITEDGSNLSAGEKQRISIARAIIKDAPIILLDEATASLDADNEFLINSALNEVTKNKTVIIIAHRLNTIIDSDQIIVLQDGKVLQKGSHEKLMSQEGKYKHMIDSIKNAKYWKI